MADLIKCPIWDERSTQLGMGNYGELHVYSARAGGEYRITGTARSTVERLSANEKALLTTWLVDQRRSGEAAPLIDSSVVEGARLKRPLRPSQKKQRFFLLALSRDFRPNSTMRIGGVVDDTYHRDSGEICAWTECRSISEMQGLLRLFSEEGLIRLQPSGELILTSQGFAFLESQEFGGAPTNQGFVAMWFDPSMDAAFKLGFEPAIYDAGYKAMRIDTKEHGNKVDDEIISELRRSRFVVADFTCGTSGARGGVYYEAGFAHGLGTPVIFTCHADCIEHVHFDTRQYNHILWTSPSELRDKLNRRIRATIV